MRDDPVLVIAIPGAPRWRLATVIGVALLAVGPSLRAATPILPQAPPGPSPSPSPSLSPEERAREAEKETLEEEAEPSPSPEPTPVPSPSPTPSPSPSPTPEPTAEPSPVPTPEPTPIPTPEPTPSPSAAPSELPSPLPSGAPVEEPSPAEPAKEEPAKEDEGGNLVQRLPTFQDITEVDIMTLLKVTAGENGARTLDDEPGLVTVLSEEDIRRTGATTLREVLQTVSGLEVLTDGVGRARIVVRGVPAAMATGSSENVLVTLNGMRLNDSIFGGATAVNLDLPVDNIKRIEIVRGAGSVLDGPGAVLGVINIVTEGTDTFRRDELTLGGGSFKSFLYNYRYGTTFHEVSVAGFLQYLYTGGPELDVPSDGQTVRDLALAPLGVRPASLAPGHTEDDRKTLDANLALAYRHLSFEARLKKENAGAFFGLLDSLGQQNRFANTQSQLSLQYEHDVPLGNVRGRLYFTESKLTQLFDVYPPGFTIPTGASRLFFPSGVIFQEDLNSRRLGADVVLERRLGSQHTVTAGAVLERDTTFGLSALTNFDFETQQPLPTFGAVPALVPDASRTVTSLYAQDAWNPTSRLGLSGGLRLDHYSDVGGTLQPRLAGVYRFPRDFTLKAGYARGARPPSFLELFYSSPAYRANDALDLVRSDSLDATVLFRRGELRVSLTGYLTWFRDAIAPDAQGFPPVGTPPPVFRNLERIDAHGADLEAARTFAGNRSVGLVYSLQHAEDDQTGRQLAGIPTHLGRFYGTFPAGKYFTLSPSLTLRGSRPRAAGDLRSELGGYALVDIAARVHNFHRAIELSAVVHDLFGKDYFDPSPFGLPGDYPRPGFSIFIKAKYRF
jgi:outer membrane receptor protein involved in Fe transport